MHEDVPVYAGEPAGAGAPEQDVSLSMLPAGSASVDEACYVPEARPVPERLDCMATTSACRPGSGCVFTPLAVTLQEFLFDSCEVYCGELVVGTNQGCITRVDNPTGSVSNFDCVSQHLLGTRWECAANDGLARIYLGSCTLR
jgi:hypothetical protein